MRNTLRTTVLVCFTLVSALVLTGFASSAYKRERVSLGQSHYERGRELVSHGGLEEGIEEYRRALLFSPDTTEYRLDLAKALMEGGRLDEAESHLEQLVQEDPTNGPINLMLARIAARRNKTQSAIEFYQRAVYEYWPPSRIVERRQARWELIGLLTAQNKRNAVVGELMQMYASMPPDPKQRAKVGALLLKDGAVSEASQVFRDILHDTPQDPAGHSGMGRVYFGFGDYVAARHEFQRALRLDPGDTESQQSLTLVNSVIDMDPALPHINSRERLRRSQNLLKAVLSEIQECSEGKSLPSNVQQDVDLSAKMLGGVNESEDDLSLVLQDRAQQLWKDRGAVCGKTSSHSALEVALASVGQ